MTTTKAAEACIRFSPQILRRLGEELNPSPDQGILELVKNAYDANARVCRVELLGTDEAGGEIRVIDDGDGMDQDDIINGWLVLGASGKSKKKRTRLGRIPSGNKGLGRLAALRLGHRAVVTTTPREDQSDYRLAIDWRAYDKAGAVDEVPLSVETLERAADKSTGSSVVLSDLRQSLGRMDIKRLARGMVLLADPFAEDRDGFKPVLAVAEFADLEKVVKRRYFDDAEFHLKARVRGGIASAKVLDWRGRTLFRGAHTDITVEQGGAYLCPDAVFDLWVFILNKSTFESRASTVGEVREWLSEFGGVHLYDSGLRVLPYGNPGNDWLELNLRRAQSPEERPSTNTSIGRVAISDAGSILVQKTDRSGYIETEAFEQLRLFAQDALDWMARKRLAVAVKRRSSERVEGKRKARKEKKRLEQAVKSAPKEARAEIKAAIEKFADAKEREVRALRKEVQLYRTLSTVGITAATFAHESTGNSIKVITLELATIERRAKKLLGDKYHDALSDPIERLRESITSLEVLSAATLRMLDHGKRRLGRVEVNAVVRGVVETFTPFAVARDVKIETILSDGRPHLRGSEAAVESIVTNLLNNSLVALEVSTDPDRRINVYTTVSEKMLTLRVADSGPGIKGIRVDDIWLPGQTTKENGTGLGLTIVKDSVADLGGEVSAVPAGEMGGAEILVQLPILGV